MSFYFSREIRSLIPDSFIFAGGMKSAVLVMFIWKNVGFLPRAVSWDSESTFYLLFEVYDKYL